MDKHQTQQDSSNGHTQYGVCYVAGISWNMWKVQKTFCHNFSNNKSASYYSPKYMASAPIISLNTRLLLLSLVLVCLSVMHYVITNDDTLQCTNFKNVS